MANVKVAENHLTYGGVAYFRANAEEIRIGSIGEKRTPITKQNYLEVKDQIPAPKIDKVRSTIVEINQKSISKSALEAGIFAIIQGIPVRLNGSNARKKLESYELKLVKFSVPINQMITAVNNSPKRLNKLVDYGKDARIVHQVFVVLEAEIAQKFHNETDVKLAIGAHGLEGQVTGSGSTSRTTKVRLEPGTCFAYLLAKIDWNANLKKNKTKVVDLDDDQWSFS
ncbi:MAG: hypothetical protein AAF702_09795 [Chloroflexota bacterium]